MNRKSFGIASQSRNQDQQFDSKKYPIDPKSLMVLVDMWCWVMAVPDNGTANRFFPLPASVACFWILVDACSGERIKWSKLDHLKRKNWFKFDSTKGENFQLDRPSGCMLHRILEFIMYHFNNYVYTEGHKVYLLRTCKTCRNKFIINA
jgi:hypothetical protein